MPDLPERKAGIVACSGEELAEGMVSRLAALKVLHESRPHETVTICLPLFLAGGEGDRAFARFHPTITVDGCELRCAARGTEMYSGKPAASIVVSELAAQQGLGQIDGRRRLNEAGRKAVDVTAQRLAELVDQVLDKRARAHEPVPKAEPEPKQAPATGCSCASGVPISKLPIHGNGVELIALPLIFQQFQEAGRRPDDAADDLLAAVKVYNYVPPESEVACREALAVEYAAYCEKESEK